MTTIAYRDGVMAADSGAWMGDASHGWARKLARAADGTLHGVSGHAAECHNYLEWIDAGCQGSAPQPRTMPEDANSFIVLRVKQDGYIELVTAQGVERYQAPYFAIGAGAATAFGALFVGANAEQAIEAAKEHGSGAFGRVQTMRHGLIGVTRPAPARSRMTERVERAWQRASEVTGVFQRRRA